MTIRFLWPGRTKDPALRALAEMYFERIRRYAPCEIVETPEARGPGERAPERVLDLEARGLEKRLKDDYIIVLLDEGREMTSPEFARLIGRAEGGPARALTFVVGGFLGLAPRLVERAGLRLSLSKMTMSHELCRVVLLEQVYRALSILRGASYAK